MRRVTRAGRLHISAAADHEVQRDLINRFGNVCTAGERRARSLTAQGWLLPFDRGTSSGGCYLESSRRESQWQTSGNFEANRAA